MSLTHAVLGLIPRGSCFPLAVQFTGYHILPHSPAFLLVPGWTTVAEANPFEAGTAGSPET